MRANAGAMKEGVCVQVCWVRACVCVCVCNGSATYVGGTRILGELFN